MLHLDFPIIEGKCQLTGSWFLSLPEKFNRRIEDGDLVIWKPGFTIWLAVWNNDHNQELEEFYASTTSGISPKAFDIKESSSDKIKFFSYRLAEETDDKRVPAFYCYAISSLGFVQAAMYFNKESDVQTAYSIWQSFSCEN